MFRLIFKGFTSSFIITSTVVSASATLQPKNESVMDDAIQEASSLKKGDREVSELLARLIQKDADLIFSVKKLGLKNPELLSLYETQCASDLERFSQKIRDLVDSQRH